MKSAILFSLLVFSATSFAASSPITEDVVLKNKEFSKRIYTALEKKIPAVKNTITIKGLISCQKTDKSVSCKLLAGGWNYLGSEAYGSGDQEKLTKKLYDSLSLKAVVEEGMSFKTIELNVEDPNGGTERNQLSCIRPGKEAAELGLRDTCQLLNGL